MRADLDIKKLPLAQQLAFRDFQLKLQAQLKLGRQVAYNFACESYFLALRQSSAEPPTPDSEAVSGTLLSAIDRLSLLRPEAQMAALVAEVAGYQYRLDAAIYAEKVHYKIYLSRHNGGDRLASDWFERVRLDVAEQKRLISDCRQLCEYFRARLVTRKTESGTILEIL